MDIITLVLSRKYTDDSLKGITGTLAGKNCTIANIEDITGGKRVTFQWTADDGTTRTNTMDVMHGSQGVKGDSGFSPTIVENANNDANTYKLDITDETGTFTTPNLKGAGGGGGGSAESTTYTAPASAPVIPDTQAQPENVQQALDVIMNEIFYTPVRIGRFDMNPGATTYEVGQSTGELTFTWSISPVDSITSVKFNNQEIPKTQTSITQPSVSTDSRYTLTITDGSGREGSTATSTKSISFLPKIYFGSAALGNVDSAFVIGLPESKLASNYRGTYSFTVNNQEYGWFAFPSNYNAPTSCYIGGFETSLVELSSIQVTNQYGDTRSYDVYRTGQMGLGSIKAEFR